ncbi:PadR family transcriptional regulator [Halorussus salinus]|uniref:PadR family transcriptional regulator n=1 Tax=Halorussus salinus TaxID=1364935 RepID=UPI001EE41645|nr:PadR family transcriptional regulator [Halorussus salinus]
MASSTSEAKEVTDPDAPTADQPASEQPDVSAARGQINTEFRWAILFVLRGYSNGRYHTDYAGPAGMDIKRALESDDWPEFSDEVHHGRLYPSLDTLTDLGVIKTHRLDQDNRTNRYELTDTGRKLLAQKLQRDIACFKGTPVGDEEDGGRDE